MRSLCFAVGTRPEAIKMAPVILHARDSGLDVTVVSSGQHLELVSQALADFGISPDFELDALLPGGELSANLSKLLSNFGKFFTAARFDYVLVHGDTHTTVAATFASFFHGIPVAHVEAGLRSHDLQLPFPEEANRAVVTQLATIHFCPTENAKQNLIREGVAADKCFVVGNSIVDALRVFVPENQIQKEDLVILTAHRRENWNTLSELEEVVKRLATLFPSTLFLLPLHPNPTVRKAFSSASKLENVSIVEPIQYKEFIVKLSRAKLLITDSGGLQEEALALGIPCLVARDITERPEVLGSGFIELVGTDGDLIVRRAQSYLERNHLIPGQDLLGRGDTASSIIRELVG